MKTVASYFLLVLTTRAEAKVGENDSQTSTQGPSKATLEAIRWTYFGIVCLLFILGVVNSIRILIIKGKWKTFPLTLMYVCA